MKFKQCPQKHYYIMQSTLLKFHPCISSLTPGPTKMCIFSKFYDSINLPNLNRGLFPYKLLRKADKLTEDGGSYPTGLENNSPQIPKVHQILLIAKYNLNQALAQGRR